jgi:copper transport protein
MALTALVALPVAALVARRPWWGVPPSTWVVLALQATVGLAAVAALNGHARTLSRPWLAVGSVTVHLLAVGVWVGGLAALVALGGPAWRKVPAGEERAHFLRALVSRFSRLAVASVVVVLATGTLNAILELHSVSDLWQVAYGRAITAKIVLLAVALGLAARHRWVLPKRLAKGDGAAVGSFERSSAWEAVALGLAVAVTAGLVVLVPGRTIALAASGPVNQTARTGGYTVQLYIDPTHVGANQFHVSFVTPDGLAAADVDNATVSLAALGAAPGSLAMRLISPGHFVGDGDLPKAGKYQLSVNATAGSAKPSTTFTFRLRQSKGATP